MRLHRFVVSLLVSLLVVAALEARAAGPDPYSTAIRLSDLESGARSSLTFAFRAVGSEVRKVDEIDLELAGGMKVDASAFGTACVLQKTGPSSGDVCAREFRGARVGEGEMTVEMLGMHTVTADAYRVQGAPDGANVVFFFAGGQVFGVGAQSILGVLDLEGDGPVRLRIHGIQEQLDLPFGATAELEAGRFTFTGESGSGGFTNPVTGAASDWGFQTRLGWTDGEQTQTVHASPATPPAAR